MYLPTDYATAGDYPRNCTLPENDWHILASFWHPVAFSSEVTDKPFKSKLLDVDVVVYRTSKGVTAAKNVCIHRGAALSLGWMDDAGENLVCPYHGLHFNHEGICTRIPSLPDQSRPISSRLRLGVFRTIERYGLIWVCMKDEPRHPLPEWPDLEQENDDRWISFQIPKSHWKTSASRHCENFNDVAHISWVHMKTFGNRQRPEIPDYELEQTDYGLRMALPYIEVERGFNDDFGERERAVHYTHELTYPFATDLRVDYEAEENRIMTSHFYDIGSPVSGHETAVYQISRTNIPGATAEDYAQYQLVTNKEDIFIVESQRPEEVPLNIREEVHIPADKFSIQYRKDLVMKFGLGSPSLTA